MSSTSLVTCTAANEKPRLASNNGDHLSNLHDSMLRHILSRLPTNYVVRTSILSKDWKYKWTLSYNVDTDLESWDAPYITSTFANFLSEILLSREHLRSFRATLWISMPYTVQKWINAAMRHNLEFLDVNLNGNLLTFPTRLLNSTSLREVKVVQPCKYVMVNVAEKNCAPNLTSLSLYNVVFVNQNLDSSSVSLDFPLLEMLAFSGITFSFGRWMNVKSVEIYAPSLTSFSFDQTKLYDIRDCDYSTKINAPRLTSFSCFNGLPENLILDGSSIVTATLSARDDPRSLETTGSRATTLVNGFTNLEELTLSRCIAEALRNGPPLHHHDKLKRLTLLSGSNANQLFMLLLAMPSLKFLTINVDKWESYDYEAMGITPSCIATHLEEVALQGYSGKVSQRIVAQFLLKAAKNLKKFAITATDEASSPNLLPLLPAFLCCSPSLEICFR